MTFTPQPRLTLYDQWVDVQNHLEATGLPEIEVKWSDGSTATIRSGETLDNPYGVWEDEVRRTVASAAAKRKAEQEKGW